MKVIPIAATALFMTAIEQETPYKQHFFGGSTENVAQIDELAELAGRNCYQSWDRPNQKTASNEGYLNNIIEQNHFSVMEHGSVTFYAEGVSRSLLAELTRHRHLSFSVVSQRYVDANALDTIYPPIVAELATAEKSSAWNEVNDILEEATDSAKVAYNALVTIFLIQGYKRKEAREAARAVLPNMMDTPLVVTGNIRAWRDVLSKRYHIAADREIQGFAEEVLKHLRVLAANCVQDIGDKYGL
jgi:thymidylate synthase (FAD)